MFSGTVVIFYILIQFRISVVGDDKVMRLRGETMQTIHLLQ